MKDLIFESEKNNVKRFKQIYDQYFKYVYSFVLSRTCGDEQRTEDIVQDTFLIAWNQLNYFQRKSSYKTWLCGIAKNKLYEEYRKQVRDSNTVTLDLETIEMISSDISVERIILNEEQRKNIIKILYNLNPIYRNCLILKYMDDCSVKEIANIFGKTPKAIDGILQRAKKNFVFQYLKNNEREKFNAR